MNQIILIGRLVKDIDIRQTTSGTTVGRFTLAVDRYGKTKGVDADFISCVAFDKKAEVLQLYTHKGSKIAVIGRIQTGSYQKDGRRVYTTDVIVNEIEFCESRSKEEKTEDISSVEEDLPFN